MSFARRRVFGSSCGSSGAKIQRDSDQRRRLGESRNRLPAARREPDDCPRRVPRCDAGADPREPSRPTRTCPPRRIASSASGVAASSPPIRPTLARELGARDLEQIAAFLALDSQQGSERVLRWIEDRAATLESIPARGRVVPELARFQMRTWRELVVRPYRLVYRTHALDPRPRALMRATRLTAAQPTATIAHAVPPRDLHGRCDGTDGRGRPAQRAVNPRG